MSEKQRLQSIAISEGQRLQAADAQGQQFMFGANEQRINMDLNRAAGQEQQAQQNYYDAKSAEMGGYAAGLGALGTITAASITGNIGKTVKTGKTGKTKKTYEGNPWSASGSETITTTTPGDDDWIPEGYN